MVPTTAPTSLPLIAFPGDVTSGEMVAMDIDQNAIYFAGQIDVFTTFGSDYLESTGAYSPFIVKINKQGQVQWTKFFNWSDNAYIYDMKLASDGSLWFTGHTEASTYTLGSNSFTRIAPTFSGTNGYDYFVAKMDSSTGSVTYAAQVGTSSTVAPNSLIPVYIPGGLAVASGNVKFIAGRYYDSPSFPGGFQPYLPI